LQNALAGACGADIGHIAYLDAGGRVTQHSTAFRNNILWTDDFLDTVSFLRHLGRRDFSKGEIIDSLNPRKVHAVADWDDPLPFVFQAITLSLRAFRLILGKLTRAPSIMR
jgi:hypothetical protein